MDHQSQLPDDYLPILDELNRIVMASGVPAEGNLFYYHQEPFPSRESVYSYFEQKRKNFALTCSEGHTMLEVGMNAGHSALLALSRGVEYHGVDIASHPYVRPAAAYLKSLFGERFYFYEGDSRVVLPRMAELYPYLRFDLIHIDGYHVREYFTADLHNSLAMALHNAWVILDDTDMTDIGLFYQEVIASGLLLDRAPQGWEANEHHGIGCVP